MWLAVLVIAAQPGASFIVQFLPLLKNTASPPLWWPVELRQPPRRYKSERALGKGNDGEGGRGRFIKYCAGGMFHEGEFRQQKLLLNNFLTQRSLQTLIYYQQTNRDRVTASWLERFENHEGLARFHGTRGLKIAWDKYITRLMTADIEHIVVSLKRRGNGLGGWSKNNPYLPARYYNYTVDIFPRDLGERLLELRAALAEEWRRDLKDVRIVQKSQDLSRRAIAVNGTDADVKRLEMPSLEGYDAAIGAGDSTAFRGGNFDLLVRLSAHQAVLRTLAALDGSGTPQARYTSDFLHIFFDEHGKGFDGDAPYHVAEHFLAKLVDQPPRVLAPQKRSEARPILLDPIGIAESIMSEQATIVALWRDLLLDIPADNALVRRQALEASFL